MGPTMDLQIGDEVIILDNYKRISDEKKGTVVKAEESDDLSYHGSPHYEMIYTVEGEDGVTYRGTYNYDYIHSSGHELYFIKPENLIKRRGFRLSSDKGTSMLAEGPWTVDELCQYLERIKESGRGDYTIEPNRGKFDLVNDESKYVYL